MFFQSLVLIIIQIIQLLSYKFHVLNKNNNNNVLPSNQSLVKEKQPMFAKAALVETESGPVRKQINKHQQIHFKQFQIILFAFLLKLTSSSFSSPFSHQSDLPSSLILSIDIKSKHD